jgi:hypothetical protein
MSLASVIALIKATQPRKLENYVTFNAVTGSNPGRVASEIWTGEADRGDMSVLATVGSGLQSEIITGQAGNALKFNTLNYGETVNYDARAGAPLPGRMVFSDWRDEWTFMLAIKLSSSTMPADPWFAIGVASDVSDSAFIGLKRVAGMFGYDKLTVGIFHSGGELLGPAAGGLANWPSGTSWMLVVGRKRAYDDVQDALELGYKVAGGSLYWPDRVLYTESEVRAAWALAAVNFNNGGYFMVNSNATTSPLSGASGWAVQHAAYWSSALTDAEVAAIATEMGL